MLIDYHIHSEFSPDSSGSIAKIAEMAVQRGIDEIAITDHYEVNSNWGDKYNQGDYFEEIERIRKIYDGRLTIRSGIEIGNVYLWPKEADEVLKYPYDYVLASVHDVDGHDLYTVDYSKMDVQRVLKAYFDSLETTVEWGGFACLAHFDLPRRYIISQGFEVDLDEFEPQIERILRKLASYGNKGLELNISGWIGTYAAGFKDTMPSRDILKMWREVGGKIVTIGTDSHSSKTIGQKCREAQDFLLECGFEEITTFEKHVPMMHKIKV